MGSDIDFSLILKEKINVQLPSPPPTEKPSNLGKFPYFTGYFLCFECRKLQEISGYFIVVVGSKWGQFYTILKKSRGAISPAFSFINSYGIITVCSPIFWANNLNVYSTASMSIAFDVKVFMYVGK